MNFIRLPWPKFWSKLQRRAEPHLLFQPSRTLFCWILAGYLFALIPYVWDLPPWLTITILLALLLRVYFEIKHLPLPRLGLTSFAGLLLILAVALHFHTVMGRPAGTALVVGFLAIKFFELRTFRDVAVVIYCCFFVCLCSLLVSQSIEYFLYAIFTIFILIAILLRAYSGDLPDQKISPMLLRSGTLFLLALPLTLILFFFFPRYGGKLQIDLGDSSMGLTDTIEPGSVAELAQSDDNAFRVVFTNGPAPPIPQMYWRALVLWDYHEGLWTTGLARPEYHLPKALPNAPLYHQQITIYPHYHNWLFALDCPVSVATVSGKDNWSEWKAGHVLQLSATNTAINHKTEYEVTSAREVDDPVNQVSPSLHALSLPPRASFAPRVLALADELYQKHPDPGRYAQAILAYFHDNGFVYTIEPGTYPKDFLAPFLFERKSGFCEHYASAFALLMRLEHIPTRLVLGYHGATYNPYGEFYLVRQSEAHAWDEYWDAPAHRWIRVDPTTALSNSNRELFSQIFEQNRDNEVALQFGKERYVFLPASSTPEWLRQAMKEFQQRRQLLEAKWDEFILSYDTEAQMKLTERLGLDRELSWTLIFICLTSFGLLAGLLIWWLNRKPTLPPVEKIYHQICRQLARQGYPRQAWESPTLYTQRIAPAFPETQTELLEMGQLVAHDRYALLTLAQGQELAHQLQKISPALFSAHAHPRS